MKIVSVPDNAILEVHFTNGVVVIGKLVVWESDFLLLEAENGSNMIITNPEKDVMMIKVNGGGVKIESDDDEENLDEENLDDEEAIDVDDDEVEIDDAGFLAPIEPTREAPQARLDRLVEERKNSIREERRAYTERLLAPPEITINHIGPTKYELPNFKK